jgi:cell division protein FtsB
MSEWITHRPPTAEDANRFGEVAVALERKPFDGVVIPGENYRIFLWHGVARGARWYPLNKEAAEAAEAEQAAIAERAAAAAEPELTPEPAAEPSPAVAGLPKASDKRLWELARAAKEQAMPSSAFPAWDDSYLIQQKHYIVAHRALYQRGDADGYRRCLKEAKATSELNSELARDLTLLQQENAQLKSRVEELVGETQVLGNGLKSMTQSVHAYESQMREMPKRIAELEQENAKLKSEAKDLAHSLSQPYAVVIGDLETELKRCGEWSTPAPEPASTEPFSCGGCRWYSDGNSETGLCCRHAPTRDGFPRVAVEGWCGEWSTPAPEPASPEPAPATRKITQIAAGTDGDNYPKVVWALCSDGTLWSYIGHPKYNWEHLPAIPQGPTQ